MCEDLLAHGVPILRAGMGAEFLHPALQVRLLRWICGRGVESETLGREPDTYYQHAVEIEVYVEEGTAAVRDAAFDSLLQQIGAALEADPRLGGLAFGLTYSRPEYSIEAVSGAPAIKSATLTSKVDYETDAPLA